VVGRSKSSFTGSHDGGNPFATVILDPDANLYGTTEIGGDTKGCDIGNMSGCGVVFKISQGKFSVLHTFNGYVRVAFPNDAAEKASFLSTPATVRVQLVAAR
jgi:uncharacterized repeat protein (TIGR03803 family)